MARILWEILKKTTFTFVFSFWGILDLQAHAPLPSLTENNPSTASLISSVKTARIGTSFWIALKIDLLTGWHTYWKNPGEGGFPPTITWEETSGGQVSSFYYLPPQKFVSEGLVSYGYENQAYYLMKVTPDNHGSPSITLKGNVSWLVCKEGCQPMDAQVSLVIPLSAQGETSSDHMETFLSLLQQLPKPLTSVETHQFKKDSLDLLIPLTEEVQGKMASLTFIPEENNIIDYNLAQYWTLTPKGFHLSIPLSPSQKKKPSLGTLKGLLKVNVEGASPPCYYEIESTKGSLSSSTNFMQILLFAFIGGLLLNMMPCVFPVLSLKAFSLVKKAHTPKTIRAEGLLFTAGVIISFLLLSSLLGILRAGGQAVGWGFQLQNPLFVAFIAYFMFFLGLNLSGVIHLPMFFTGSQEKLHGKADSFATSFWMGVLSVMVASPCTAPFMGVAVGYGLTQSSAVSCLVFLTLGIGFAFPFLSLSLFPGLWRYFPKPGPWMETFKEIMAFPLYFTVVWLMWTLSQQLTTTHLFFALCGLVNLAFACWLWKQLYSLLLKRPAFIRAVFLATLFIFTLSPLIFISSKGFPGEVPSVEVSKNIEESFTPETLSSLRQQGKGVLVYATAAWCITCKYNEIILQSPTSRSFYKSHDIVLLKADWTNKNPQITKFLEGFGYTGVPLYVYYPPHKKGVVLPQLLTQSTFIEKLKEAGL